MIAAVSTFRSVMIFEKKNDPDIAGTTTVEPSSAPMDGGFGRVTPVKSSVDAPEEVPAPMDAEPLVSARFVQGPGVVRLANPGTVGMGSDVRDEAGVVAPGVVALQKRLWLPAIAGCVVPE